MKLLVFVFTMATAVLESQTIIVLDNTKQLPHEEQAVAESSRDDVKIHGFSSSVVHKPGSSDTQVGGLTVQDPPKGWPFSEINVNFNSLTTENEPKVHPGIATHRPEQSSRIQKQQQRLKHQHMNQQLIRQHHEKSRHIQRDLMHSQQQNLHQNPHQASTPVRNGDGFTQTANSDEYRKPPPYIITVNGHEQSGIVPKNSDQSLAKGSTEAIPKTIILNNGLRTGYHFGFLTPPNTLTHNNQMFNVIKQKFSASGDGKIKLLSGQRPQDYSQDNHGQATGAHMSPGNGDPNYVWRDVSPGLEISSNAPQLAGELHRNSAATRVPDTTSGHIVNGKVGGHSHASRLQVPTFDHANALGQSANFDYTDAVLSTPAQFQASQKSSVTVSQDHSAGVHGQQTQYQNSVHEIQNAVPETGKRNENIGSVVTGHNNGAGIVGQAGHIQHSQHQQQSEVQTVLPQANYGVDVTSHKDPLSLNRGLVQGIPGSLVLGNEFHLGYVTKDAGQQNVFLPMQDMVNSGYNESPFQAFYFPLLGFKSGQVQNHQPQVVTAGSQHVGDVQRNHPGVVDTHVVKGVMNTAPMFYVELPMVNGYAGFSGLPLVQGNIYGIQGLHGMVGGTHQNGGMFIGGNTFSLPDGKLALDNQNNVAHKTYKQALESVLQATSQNHHHTFQAQGNQYTPMPTGKDTGSFENSAPYQHQQLNNQQSQTVTPQINVHPNGFTIKVQQQHPIPQHSFNSGGYHKLPFGGNRFSQQPSDSSAHDFVLGVPKTLTRGYQTPSLPPHSAANSQPAGFKLNPLPVSPLTQPPLNVPHQASYSHSTVKRDENVSKPPAHIKVVTHFRDMDAQGWQNNYLGSKTGKPPGPSVNYNIPTNTPHVIGLRPPNVNNSFLK